VCGRKLQPPPASAHTLQDTPTSLALTDFQSVALQLERTCGKDAQWLAQSGDFTQNPAAHFLGIFLQLISAVAAKA
jgi:hypothetical protein